MGNVTELKPFQHWRFEVYEQRHGYKAEGHRNGVLMWEYETDSLPNIKAVIERNIGEMNDSPNRP